MVRPAISDEDVQSLGLMSEHLKTHPGIDLEMPATMWWIVISQMQLALRHPKNKGASAKHAREILDRLIVRMANGNADIETLLRRGDDPRFDR